MTESDGQVIRVKDFAKTEFIQNRIIQNSKVDEILQPIVQDIDIVCLSSDEEESTKKYAKNHVLNTSNSKPKTKPRRLPTANRNRFPKTPLKFKYHKISEYFAQTKKDYTINMPPSQPSVTKKDIVEINSDEQIDGPAIKTRNKEKIETQRLLSRMKAVKVVLKRLPGQESPETARKRKVTDQIKVTEFIDYKPPSETYFTTYASSVLPLPLPLPQMVRIENLQLLKNVSIESIRRKIPNIVVSETTSKASIDITDETSNDCYNNSENKDNNDNVVSTSAYNLRQKKKKQANMIVSKAPAKTRQNMKRKKTECPHYKIISGTKLAVDAFRYGDIDGVEHYFLSHFHADHYIGLKKSFNHKLYLSDITGRLVKEFIKVEQKRMTYLQVNTPIVVDGTEVTALDANHCPGAVMFLFKLPTGRCILHTGDFRASAEMEEYPEFWNYSIDTIYLDTTYLSSKYEFYTQAECILRIIKECRDFSDKNSSGSGKNVIICGAYKIGKEKVWLRIAQDLDCKVWIDKERRKAIDCINNQDIFNVLSDSPRDARIHVLPLGNITYQFVSDYVDQFGETFTKALAIRPSGWEKNARIPNYSNRISILGIQYSEHSSYNELERFIRFLQPREVISTVPINSHHLERTPKIPESWLNNSPLEPKKQSYQKNIVDFMIKKPKPNEQKKNVKEEKPTPTINRNNTVIAMEQIVESISIEDDISDDFMP